MGYSRDDEERILVAWATNDRCHKAWRLRITDFSTPAARFVFEVVGKFSEKYGMLPGPDTAGKEIELALRGDSQFTYRSKPDQAIMPAVGDLLVRMGNGLPEAEILRIGDTLPAFLDQVRVAQVARLAAENSWDTGRTVEAMHEAHADAKAVTGVDPSDELSSGCEVDLEAMEHPEPRIATGLSWLDVNTNGGLVRGNVALLVAPSGLGKTVGMINFCANANISGLYSLFMTLENPKKMIQRRWQSIMGHIPAGSFSKPLAMWPKDVSARFRALTSKECVYWDKFSILDKSGRALITIDGIERAIVAWRRQKMDAGIPEEKLGLVCIDWLKYIDMSSVPGVTKNSRADEPISLAIQALGGIARRNKVVIWTAQQATRKAQNKEVIGPEDIADSTAIQNYLDLGIAFARQTSDQQAKQVTMTGSSVPNQSETDRHLVLSCFKARESAIAGQFEDLYQGPTLRIWDNREQSRRLGKMIETADPVAHYCRKGETP